MVGGDRCPTIPVKVWIEVTFLNEMSAFQFSKKKKRNECFSTREKKEEMSLLFLEREREEKWVCQFEDEVNWLLGCRGPLYDQAQLN